MFHPLEALVWFTCWLEALVQPDSFHLSAGGPLFWLEALVWPHNINWSVGGPGFSLKIDIWLYRPKYALTTAAVVLVGAR